MRSDTPNAGSPPSHALTSHASLLGLGLLGLACRPAPCLSWLRTAASMLRCSGLAPKSGRCTRHDASCIEARDAGRARRRCGTSALGEIPIMPSYPKKPVWLIVPASSSSSETILFVETLTLLPRLSIFVVSAHRGLLSPPRPLVSLSRKPVGPGRVSCGVPPPSSSEDELRRTESDDLADPMRSKPATALPASISWASAPKLAMEFKND